MSKVPLKPIAKPPNKSEAKANNLSSFPIPSPIEFAPNSPFAPLKLGEENSNELSSPSIPAGATLLKYSSSPRPSPFSSASPLSLMAILQRQSKPHPVPKSNEYKSVANYRDLILKDDAGYIEYLQEIAAPLFLEKGPLCDSEGFYQHNGECWNDSLQQLFFNADGLKEVVQNSIVTRDFSTHLVYLPNTIFIPFDTTISKEDYTFMFYEEIDMQKQWIHLYLAETQKRFLRHYIAEALRRKQKIESCAMKEPEDIAREKLREIGKHINFRKKGIEGRRAAILGKTNPIENYAFRPSLKEYTEHFSLTGGTGLDIDILFNVFNEVFFSHAPLKINYQTPLTIKNGFPDLHSFEKFIERVTASLLTCSNRSKPEGDFHELAIYQCGGTQYLFDNNSGSIQFEWKKFFALYLDLLLQGLTAVIIFIPVNFYDESNFLRFDYYPMLQHFHKSGHGYESIIFIEDEIINLTNQASDVLNPNFKFKVDLEDIHAYGEIERKTINVFDRIAFLYSSKDSKATNTNFTVNSSLRLKRNPLEIYILNRDIANALKYIEEAPVIPNLKGMTQFGDAPILFLAIETGQSEIALQLIEKGYTYTYEIAKVTPILHALFKHLPDVFQKLITLGGNLTYVNNSGLQAIHYASQKETPFEFLKMLLDAGVDVNSMTKNKETPLFLATVDSEIEKIKLLCSKGADPTLLPEGTESILLVAKSAEVKTALESCGKKGGYKKRLTRYKKLKSKPKKKTYKK